jgi:hypothetical protein
MPGHGDYENRQQSASPKLWCHFFNCGVISSSMSYRSSPERFGIVDLPKLFSGL